MTTQADLSQYLYRFRSTQALLGDYQELELQQIYFSPPEQLNDPLEGFKDIFWEGDRIVWRNLFRHYLLNLLQATSLSSIMGQEFTPDQCATLVHQTDDDLPQAPIQDIYASACRMFFEFPTTERLINTCSSPGKAIRRDELIFYLQMIHPLAIHVVLTALGQRGLSLMTSTATLDELVAGINQKLDEVLRENTLADEVSAFFYSVTGNIQSQLALIHEFHNPVTKENPSWLFIARDFPDYYATVLERLLYPDWHVACFVSNPLNASMWGTYADSHRGVCLKFKTRADAQGTRTLDLYRASSWGGNRQDGIVANYSFVPHSFQEVQYTSEFPEVDFFESIATLPRSKLEGFWFSDLDGKRSTTAPRMLSEDAQWRNEYWRKFATISQAKTSEWKHEEEQRLILYSHLQRFDDQESRKLKYQFDDLVGIIFGIKTTTEDKLNIMRIIEQKCITEKRQNFEFLQAHYSPQSKRIEVIPLSLLKVQKDTA